MSATRILPVAVRNAGDLASICCPDKSDPLWKEAVKAKREWIRERLHELGTFAWIAYNGADPVGMIQCHPEKGQVNVAFIDCLWIPKKSHWGRGIGTKLLAEVEGVMQRQHHWFDGKPADGIAAASFHGEAEGQQSAEAFYEHHGFVRIEGVPDVMFKAFTPEIAWTPDPGSLPAASAQPSGLPEDAGRVTVLLGPVSCPFQYSLLSKTGAYVGEKLHLPVTEINAAVDPDGYKAHGTCTGILVNGHPVRHNLLEREKLDDEVSSL